LGPFTAVYVGKAFSPRTFNEALVGHGSIGVKYLCPLAR
jgi:hypothetical protein